VFTILGNIFLNFLGKKDEKKSVLEEILKSFAIGSAIHISISTLTISFELFNFFTAYLPFILVDIAYIFLLLYRNKGNLQGTFTRNKFIEKIKANYNYLLIFLIVIILQLSLQLYFLDIALAYPEKDPYLWYYHIMYSIKNGMVDPEGGLMMLYAPGYILLNSTALSVTNDYYLMFFFMKYIPVFLLFINILVIFIIARKIFDKKIYILLTLTIFLSFHYLISRYLENFPSILAVTFGFLFLLFLDESIIDKIDKNNSKILVFTKQTFLNKNLIFRGLILAAICLANTIYYFFYLIFYFFYEFFLLLVFVKDRGYLSRPNLYKIIRFIISLFVIFFFSLIFILPYVIGVDYQFHKGNVFFTYIRTFLGITLSSTNNINVSFLLYLGNIFRDLGYLLYWSIVSFGIDRFFTDFVFNTPIVTEYIHFYTRTIGIGIFIILIGLIFHRKTNMKSQDEDNYLINFLKFTLIMTFVFYTFIWIMSAINTPFTQRIYEFFWIFEQRLFEQFAGFWSILFVFGFIYILRYFFNLIKKWKKNIDFTEEKMVRRTKTVFLLAVVLTGGYFYLNNYYNVYYAYYDHDDYRIDALLFVGNYFNENPLELESTILVQETNDSITYSLIAFTLNLKFEYFDYLSNNSYTNFTAFYNSKSCSYSLIPKLEVDGNFIGNLTLEYHILYENYAFIFSKNK